MLDPIYVPIIYMQTHANVLIYSTNQNNGQTPCDQSDTIFSW